MVEQITDDEINLELTPDDMYADGYVVIFPDGTQILQVEDLPYERNIGDDYLEVINGDRLDAIAFEKYGNSKEWHIIAKANKIFNPFELIMGSGLIIPKINNDI